MLFLDSPVVEMFGFSPFSFLFTEYRDVVLLPVTLHSTNRITS